MKETSSRFHLAEEEFCCLYRGSGSAIVPDFATAFGRRDPNGLRSAAYFAGLENLAAGVLSGPHHRVEEAVNNNGYFNIYRIDSKFGVFTAVSTAMLRKRIGEINAMVVMEKIQGTKEYLDSIKEGGLDAMQSAMSLVTSPVQTLSGAARGDRRGLRKS